MAWERVCSSISLTSASAAIICCRRRSSFRLPWNSPPQDPHTGLRMNVPRSRRCWLRESLARLSTSSCTLPHVDHRGPPGVNPLDDVRIDGTINDVDLPDQLRPRQEVTDCAVAERAAKRATNSPPEQLFSDAVPGGTLKQQARSRPSGGARRDRDQESSWPGPPPFPSPWQASGGFSVDASVLLYGSDAAGRKRLLRYGGLLVASRRQPLQFVIECPGAGAALASGDHPISVSRTRWCGVPPARGCSIRAGDAAG
jgi:hypothetical protein